MEKYKYNLLFILVLLVTGGCATGSLFVDSSPAQSTVYMKALGGSYKEIGKTPLTKKLTEITDVFNATDSMLLEVRKDGYVSEQILITDIVTRSDLKVTVSLDDLNALIEKEKQRQLASTDGTVKESPAVGLMEVNGVIDDLFEAQRLVKVGRTDDALRKLEEVQKVNSQLAVVYEMQGGIAYLKKDYNTALDAYTMAVKYNPKNIESVNMRKYLLDILVKRSGGRVPSNN